MKSVKTQKHAHGNKELHNTIPNNMANGVQLNGQFMPQNMMSMQNPQSAYPMMPYYPQHPWGQPMGSHPVYDELQKLHHEQHEHKEFQEI